MFPERILVACPMKCGSTYVAKVLALYFGLERRYPLHYWARQEQNLESTVMESLKRASFVLQLHSKPYVPLIRWSTGAEVHLIFLWRNIADALVSLDEHIRTEDHRVPACYIHDQAKYASLLSEERYAFLVQYAAPWYIQFYLMWKRADAIVPIIKGHYEHLLASPVHFFERLISYLAGSVDQNSLTALINRKLDNTRFNQGISGRSRCLFSKSNKWQLERLLREHTEDLSALANELPWNGNQWRSDVFHHAKDEIAIDLLVSEEFARLPVGNISETSFVKQSFRCRLPGLSTIELLGATYEKQIPSGVLKARLEQGGHPIRYCEVPLPFVKDNTWFKITFPPIVESGGGDFELIVSVADAPEDFSFSLWSSDLNPHRRGTLRFADVVRSGSLCMRIGCTAP
jgi:hypothetical protein